MLEASETPSSEDKLTGLQTDRMLRNAVQTELRRARRYRQKAALVLFDLDNFADVNARLGRLVGDRLLRETAILLSNNSRDIDLAARPGDDEFAVLLPEADRNGAVLVAERFRREVDEFFSRREGAGKPIGLTVSAGVACYPDDASSPETLLENVAMALYQAKALGKNVVHAYQPERRRYLRFDLEPGRFEVEVLSPPDRRLGRTRNLSRNGILFTSPEALDVGEEIEIRLLDSAGEAATRSLRIRGLVVRLEELPEPQTPPLTTDTVDDRYEVGVAYDLDGGASTDDLFDFLQQQSRQGGQRS